MEIKSTNDLRKDFGIYVGIYGPSGIGKTYLATFFENCLIMDLEGGITSIDKPTDYIIVDLDNIEATIREVGKSKYKNIFFDSATMLETMLKLHYSEKSKMGVPTMQDYHKLKININKYIMMLKNLRILGKNVIVTFLENQIKIEEGDGTLVTMAYPYLETSQNTLIKKLVGDFDVFGRMEMGKKERFFRLEASEKVFAKDRIFNKPAINIPQLVERLGK